MSRRAPAPAYRAPPRPRRFRRRCGRVGRSSAFHPRLAEFKTLVAIDRGVAALDHRHEDVGLREHVVDRGRRVGIEAAAASSRLNACSCERMTLCAAATLSPAWATVSRRAVSRAMARIRRLHGHCWYVAPRSMVSAWTLKIAYPSATASPQGWAISVAPLLVSPWRSTTLGQANFIGNVCTRASS